MWISAVVLGVWLLAQPWFLWPHLSASTSTRLTLVVCCVVLGLLRFGETRPHRPLPRLLCWWIAAVLSVMMWHHWHLIREASYFEFFQETALFADGVFVVIALTWGLWALWQLPASWFRWFPRIGTIMCAIAMILAIAQTAGLDWHFGQKQFRILAEPERYGLSPYKASGFLGYDRYLGAYAVAWLPVLWTWWKPLILIPLVCLFLASKVTAWIGVGVVAWWLLPDLKWKLCSVFACLAAAWWWSDGTLGIKLSLRWMTWQHTWKAIQDTWATGIGFHPMSGSFVMQRYGYALPGIHSDWLSLALHASGWIAAWAGSWTIWSLCRPAKTKWSKACQASLAALAVMSLGQCVLSSPNIAALALLLVVWYWNEQQGVVT